MMWYAALPGLPATYAATAQLSVRIIAAIGGLVVLDETVTTRLVLATLGGIALVMLARTVPLANPARRFRPSRL